MKVTIKQIESFLAVASDGNFSSAARRLGTAQPALSQAVRDLETELGVRLFDRTTRRVELTSAGREFMGSAGKVMDDLDHAIQNARDLAERKRGRIRIAAPPLLAAVVLPRAIAAFQAQHPGITLELVDVGTEQIVESVLNGQAECGLGTFPPDEAGIERTVLMRDNLMLFCDYGSAFNGHTTVDWADLKGQPLITLTRDSGIRLLVEVGFESVRLPLKPAFEVSLITTALALVEAGLGIAVLPTYALASAQHHKVTGKILTNPSIAREVVLIHASGRSVSPATAAFASVVRRMAQRLTPREQS
ncbi:LysR family transcriptional regulator [uncultured Nitratireductor sp.]|uniref:LysR family transcriptional regulator n=1 Tax=uncultured Nitratireductor sp. TaxID=520953 RepID=UPI0025EB5A15|nr:LysR family transcriptional regulator [uncultured Nitratireductor sp.]